MSVKTFFDYAIIIIPIAISIIAVIISIVTARQNAKNIEKAYRTYIDISIDAVFFNSLQIFLIIKNQGKNSAVITEFTSLINLNKLLSLKTSAFSYIKDTNFTPNRSIRLLLDARTFFDLKPFDINVKYSSGKKVYTENIVINPIIYKALITQQECPENDELKQILWTLQDIAIKNL